METQSSMPAEGGNFFMVDSATGIVSRNSEEPLDFDAGYHVMELPMSGFHLPYSGTSFQLLLICSA